MLKRRRLPVWLGLIALCAAPLSAGDVAAFVDLGFSQDGKYYAFAQYGVEEARLLPWAELFVVDVAANDFVAGGRLSFKHTTEIEAGQDGSGALFRLVSQNTALTGKYGITFLRQGVPLFISLENGHDPAGDLIEFRDFENDARYMVKLTPSVKGSGAALSSSFSIKLDRGANTNSADTSYMVGSPEIRRSNITSYTIKKALISPDRKSMVFVIEMTRQNSETAAPDIRYMIEAVRF